MDVSQLSGLILLLVLILIVALFLQYYSQRWPVRNFPPGPTGIPILGTVLTTGSDMHFHTTASKLVKRYGNVCSFMVGKYMRVCDLHVVCHGDVKSIQSRSTMIVLNTTVISLVILILLYLLGLHLFSPMYRSTSYINISFWNLQNKR